MNKLILILILGAAGCVSPTNEQAFVERLSRQLSENNASWFAEIPSVNGTLRLGRANPTIGFNGIVTSNGVSMLSSSNIAVQVLYHTVTPPPSMPAGIPETNQPTKGR